MEEEHDALRPIGAVHPIFIRSQPYVDGNVPITDCGSGTLEGRRLDTYVGCQESQQLEEVSLEIS